VCSNISPCRSKRGDIFVGGIGVDVLEVIDEETEEENSKWKW